MVTAALAIAEPVDVAAGEGVDVAAPDGSGVAVAAAPGVGVAELPAPPPAGTAPLLPIVAPPPPHAASVAQSDANANAVKPAHSRDPLAIVIFNSQDVDANGLDIVTMRQWQNTCRYRK